MLRVGKKPWWIEVVLEPRDCWVGVYWIRKPSRYATTRGMVLEEVHVYICLIPCVPVHIIFGKEDPDHA